MQAKYMVATMTMLALSQVAQAQITLTDGLFHYTVDPANRGEASLVYRNSWDFLDQQWWWLREAGAETALPPPSSVRQPDDTHASLEWDGLLGGSLDGTLALELVVTGSGRSSAKIVQSLELVNSGQSPLEVSLFHYLDTRSFIEESRETALGGLPLILVDLGIIARPAEWLATDADAFQVAEAPELLDLLMDPLPTELDNTGLPFGPGDFSGAIQWNASIAPGEGVSLVTSFELFVPAPMSSLVLGIGACCFLRRRRA